MPGPPEQNLGLPRNERSTLLLHSGIAVATVALATLIRLWLDPILHERGPFTIYFAAIMLVAWYADLLPTLLTVFLGALAATYFFLPPEGFSLSRVEDAVSLGLYLAVGVFISVLSGHQKRELRKRKQGEEALQSSEERLRFHVENTPLAVIEWGPDCRLSGWSSQAERIFGWKAEEVLGKRWDEFRWVHEEDVQQVARVAAGLADGSCPSSVSHHRNYRKDGSVAYCEWYSSSFLDASGRLRSVLSLVLDATDRKRLETQLAERTALAQWRASQLQRLTAELTHAEEQQRRRLARVLHDHLQQFLVAAKLELARMGGKVRDDRLAAGIERTQNLLDEAIRESRSLTAELSPPVLYDRGLAAGLEWLGRRTEEKHHIRTVVEADPSAEPQDDTIKVFVFQAARELILNAAKHGCATSVTLRLSNVNEGNIHLIVMDDGVGCDPEKMNARGETGGFGLFSIRERLHLIGGNLEITSVPGQGTRATITVPYRAVRPAATTGVKAAQIPPSALPSSHTGRTRVLLADDHPMLRKGLADLLLEQPAIDLLGEASDGQEAMEMALQLRPDVILMDVSMPRMDGIEATRRIKEAAPEICIIGLSMHESGDMENTMRSAGADYYLVKSAAAEELISAIVNRCPQT